jgi:hypothetical protein
MEVIKTSKIDRIKEGAKNAAKYVKHDALVIGGTLLAAVAAVGIYSAIKTSNDNVLAECNETTLAEDLVALEVMEATETQE